jgi:hypothetical protein
VLADFLVSAGIKPSSIVSYNHLGNNDGMNLSAPKQFRSKEVCLLHCAPLATVVVVHVVMLSIWW